MKRGSKFPSPFSSLRRGAEVCFIEGRRGGGENIPITRMQRLRGEGSSTGLISNSRCHCCEIASRNISGQAPEIGCRHYHLLLPAAVSSKPHPPPYRAIKIIRPPPLLSLLIEVNRVTRMRNKLVMDNDVFPFRLFTNGRRKFT